MSNEVDLAGQRQFGLAGMALNTVFAGRTAARPKRLIYWLTLRNGKKLIQPGAVQLGLVRKRAGNLFGQSLKIKLDIKNTS